MPPEAERLLARHTAEGAGYVAMALPSAVDVGDKQNEFANAWGADAITLKCEIDTGSVSDDGTVVLQGFSFEEDFDEFGNVIFEELSPCEIIIDPSGSFSLRWCALPALNLEITKGHLKVK